MYVLASDDDTSYADTQDVAGDIVLEEQVTVYSASSDSVLASARIERHPDDYGAGEATGPLDDGGDGDELLFTAADMAGRIQVSASWYDRFGRVTDTVTYGTYGGSDFDRDGLGVPARSDTALRTTYAYGIDGSNETVEDPMGVVTRYVYDDAGRVTSVVRNYDASVNSGDPSGTDDNQTETYEYTDGLRTKIVVDMPAGQTDQETLYTYGTTKGASAGDSKIATGDLLETVQYGDSSGGTDVVSLAYDAQGELIYRKDQAGNVVEIDYDTAGRREHERVTTLATGFDGAIRRISRTWTAGGAPERVTQYDDATVGSGSVVNEIEREYDDWGKLVDLRIDRNSAVDASGSVDDYSIGYSWEKATSGRNTLRRTGTVLPSGNSISYEYRSTNALHDDEASRITRIMDGAVLLCEYTYLGVSYPAGINYREPDVRWDRFDASTTTYPDLDRFNRVTSSRWTKNLTTDVDFYDIDVTYDRNGAITLIEDNIHAGFDVQRTLDDLNRVTRAEEGTWSGSAITSRTRDQQWTLSHASNWDVAKLDLDGDGLFTGTGESNDDRTHNAGDELTARDTDDDGTDDYTLTYDAAGNLTDDGESYEYQYDGFRRLRKVLDRTEESVVAEMQWDGRDRRIALHYDADGDGDVDGSDEWYYFVHDDAAQLIAVFREDDSSPKEEFHTHANGSDGPSPCVADGAFARDKDDNSGWRAQSDGVLEQRIYLCQNHYWDVSALVQDSGYLVEWAKYSSYGVPFGLPGGDTDSDGDCDSSDVTQIQSWIDTSTYDVRGDVNLDGVVDSSDKSTVQTHYQGTSLGWRNLSAARSVHGQLGKEWDPVLRRGYAASPTFRDGLTGRSLARRERSVPSVIPGNRYQTVSLSQQRAPAFSPDAGFGRAPSTAQRGVATAMGIFKDLLACTSACPSKNVVLSNPRPSSNNWYLFGATTVTHSVPGSCGTGEPCRLRGTFHPYAFNVHADPQIQGCVPDVAFPANTLCWGWHGNMAGDNDPNDNIKWHVSPPDKSDSTPYFEAANLADNSQPPYGECVNCADSKGDLDYSATSVNVVPLQPTSHQVQHGADEAYSYMPNQECAVVDTHVIRSYECEAVAACASALSCDELSMPSGKLFTGCPLTE